MGCIWFPKVESTLRQTDLSVNVMLLLMELVLSVVSGEMDPSSVKMDIPCPLKTTKIKSFIALA